MAQSWEDHYVSMLERSGYSQLERLPRGMSKPFLGHFNGTQAVIKIAQLEEHPTVYKNILTDAKALSMVQQKKGIVNLYHFNQFEQSPDLFTWITRGFPQPHNYIVIARSYIHGDDNPDFHSIQGKDGKSLLEGNIRYLHNIGIAGLDLVTWRDDSPDHIYNLVIEDDTGLPWLIDLGQTVRQADSWRRFNELKKKDWNEFELVCGK